MVIRLGKPMIMNASKQIPSLDKTLICKIQTWKIQ